MAFPDTCLTPAPPAGPVPIPYPNIAQLAQALFPTVADRVQFMGKNAVTTQTEIPMSSGDEAGVAGGVMSGMIKGSCKIKMGSSKVKAQGAKVAHLCSMVGQNGTNPNAPAGQQIAPSQTKVLVIPG
jgi:hypothetical protein